MYQQSQPCAVFDPVLTALKHDPRPLSQHCVCSRCFFTSQRASAPATWSDLLGWLGPVFPRMCALYCCGCRVLVWHPLLHVHASSQLQLLHLDGPSAMCFVLRLCMPWAAVATAWQAPPLALLVCCLVVTSCLCLLVGGLYDGLEKHFCMLVVSDCNWCMKGSQHCCGRDYASCWLTVHCMVSA